MWRHRSGKCCTTDLKSQGIWFRENCRNPAKRVVPGIKLQLAVMVGSLLFWTKINRFLRNSRTVSALSHCINHESNSSNCSPRRQQEYQPLYLNAFMALKNGRQTQYCVKTDPSFWDCLTVTKVLTIAYGPFSPEQSLHTVQEA